MGQQSSNNNLCENNNIINNKGLNDLVFYLTVDDKQFGRIQVYSSTKKPSSYVAKIQKNIQNSKIYNIFEQIQNYQLNCLASLHAFEIIRQKYFTGYIKQKITAYWEYYNYSLEDFLKMRYFKRIQFNQSQIWLIIKSLCQSYCIFKNNNLILDLDLKHIMIIPEGKLKIYWHHVELDNSHLRFNRKIKQMHKRRKTQQYSVNNQFKIMEQNQLDNFYYAPEEIQAIEKKQETLKIDFSRANSFRLGMILLYCITLTNPIKTCYGNHNVTGNRKIKLMVLNSLYENKVQNEIKYSDDLKHLIKLLLLQDCNKRISIDCIRNIYDKYWQEDVQLQMGMNQNPLYAPSSQRNYQKENNKQINKRLQQYNRQSAGNNHENNKSNAMSSKQNIESNRVAIQSNRNIMIRNDNKRLSYNKNESKINSWKVIMQSSVRNNQMKPNQMKYNQMYKNSRQHQYNENNNAQSRSSNNQQVFDKFDTKTIKISSNYHRR